MWTLIWILEGFATMIGGTGSFFGLSRCCFFVVAFAAVVDWTSPPPSCCCWMHQTTFHYTHSRRSRCSPSSSFYASFWMQIWVFFCVETHHRTRPRRKRRSPSCGYRQAGQGMVFRMDVLAAASILGVISSTKRDLFYRTVLAIPRQVFKIIYWREYGVAGYVL